MNSNLTQNTLRASLPLVESFLNSSEVICLAVLARNGSVRFANQEFARFLKIDFAEMAGIEMSCFLTAPDAVSLSLLLSDSDDLHGKELLLNFVDSDQSPHSLRCQITATGDGYLFLGEPSMRDDQALQTELLQLNNQLSVLSRENVRKGRELAKALAELKRTQSLLVHQEKMASLGQMTAGIAHEINNPLAFVLGNEQVLQRDFNDLLEFINFCGNALPEIATLSAPIHESIIGKAEDIGLDYLTEAVPRKLEANIEGLERVKRIVLDLRTFARLDEAERKSCHLAEGIDSTLRFLGPLLQDHGVTVETDFAPLPELFCSPGPLNQAISNILANAIQASHPGQTVHVATHLDGNWCSVDVSDQGEGIPAEHLPKVFDPFFTTKPVGMGTGLGLSIAHQIIDAHQGRIEINSRPGKGTKVRLLLPVVPTDRSLDPLEQG